MTTQRAKRLPVSDAAVDAVVRQRRYYAETAEHYDDMHSFAEHRVALWQVAAFIRALEARTLLDTGCGTGLAMRYLAASVPGLSVHGNDPSEALLAVAQRRFGVVGEQLDCADSTKLPYEDGAFDVVVETAVLHHVHEPDRVIREMLRVSRKAIFISDSNSYALGNFGARVAKVALSATGTLKFVNRLRRQGHDWYYTSGDGVGWSYSVFDSLPLIRSACSEVLVIPTQTDRPLAGFAPFLFSSHLLVAGFKQPLDGAARDSPRVTR